MQNGTPENNVQCGKYSSRVRIYRALSLAELRHLELAPTSPSDLTPRNPPRPSAAPHLAPTRLSDPLPRDRLAPLAPSAPFASTSRSVMHKALDLRPNGPNGPHRLARTKRAPKRAPSNELATLVRVTLSSQSKSRPTMHATLPCNYPAQCHPNTVSCLRACPEP
jgi:hypothetical protein